MQLETTAEMRARTQKSKALVQSAGGQLLSTTMKNMKSVPSAGKHTDFVLLLKKAKKVTGWCNQKKLMAQRRVEKEYIYTYFTKFMCDEWECLSFFVSICTTYAAIPKLIYENKKHKITQWIQKVSVCFTGMIITYCSCLCMHAFRCIKWSYH